jgi:thiamine kinase-like enzyme
VSDALRERVRALRIWDGPVEPAPLAGGITNVNFTVADRSGKYVVRVGDDLPLHQILRCNESAASRAAAEAGISPEVVHAEPGILVLRFIASRTLQAQDVREARMLERIVPLLRRVHREVPRHLRGPALIFWVFHVLRDYAHTLREGNSRHGRHLARLMAIAAELERALGPVDIVYGHNDLLAANFLDDGTRLWLIDWDYAGFNTPLFDLANLATNNELDPAQERWLLDAYYGGAAGPDVVRGFAVMKCASLLRETMWSMVSELHSTLAFDYAAYTAQNLARFERALAHWREAG